MRNIAFVIWLLGFPLMLNTCSYIYFLIGRTPSDSNIFDLIVFVVVAIMLYEIKSKERNDSVKN